MVSPERSIFLDELTSQEMATAAYLLRGLFDLGRERLGAGPAVFGDVKGDVLGGGELFLEIPGLVPALALVDVMLRAEAFEPLGKLVDVLDQHAEMVDAAVVHALAELIGPEFEDRHVQRAVA